MSPSSSLPEAHRRLVRESLQAARGHGLPARQDADGVQPGDMYVLPGAAAHGVEWLVATAAPDGEMLLIPADAFPGCGGGDLPIPSEEGAGPLALRCRLATRLRVRDLHRELWVRRLAPGIVERARGLVQQLEHGGPASAEHETDRDPDYRQWVEETLVPAQAALLRWAEEHAAELDMAPEASPPSSFWGGGWLKIAAAVSLALSGGLLVVVANQQRQVRQLIADGQEAAAGFEARLEQLRQELAEAKTPTPEVNVPVFRLLPGAEVRGGGMGAPPDTGSARVMVLVALEDPLAYTHYRLRLRDGSGVSIFVTDRARPSGGAELTLTLPRAWLESPKQLDVFGLKDDRELFLASYELRFRP